MIKVEVCSNSVQSSIEAQKGGAIRVELCDNLAEGGTTPALSQIELTRQLINIELNVIIRPRGGDFLYSDIEFETMKKDIHHCGKAKCNGVVIGILNNDGNIDKKRNQILIDIAKSYNMNITFHRAFDRCKDLYLSLEDIINLGCDRILTSGGEKTALAGKEIIKKLIDQAKDRIIIMPGSGITENNIYELVKATGLKEFHGTFKDSYKGNMEYITDKLGSFDEEYSIIMTNKDKVKKAIDNANKL